MSTEELIDNKISLDQVQKAVDALHAYESKKQSKREDTQLITGKEPNIWLNVTVKQVAPKNKIKPVKIPIAYPLVDPRTTSICLITKDPQREYKELLETHNIKFISRVVDISKLRGKFKPYEARRLLLKENGLFLADDRVIPLLPKLLGVKWFEAKKQPIPVCLARKDLKAELERAISSTYMNQNNGTCTSIKIGTLTHKPTQIVQNIIKSIPTIIQNTPGGWENIQSFFIKTNTSVSLPIWNCNLESGEGGRWNGFTKTVVGVDEEGLKEGEKEGKKRSRKRKVSKVDADAEVDVNEVDVTTKAEVEDEDEEVEEEEQQPRKKIKSSETSTVTVTTTKVKDATKSKSKSKSKSPKTADVAVKSTLEPKEKEKKKKTPVTVSEPTTSSSVFTKKSIPKEKKPSSPTKTPTPTSPSPSKTKPFPKEVTKGLSKDEMKQKKATLDTDKKKKDKVVSVSGTKKSGVRSAKGNVLGKKAFQG